MNGGAKKAVIGVAATAIAGVGGYILNASSRVAPLAVKVESIDEKMDDFKARETDTRHNQNAWNDLFLTNQRKADDKLDQLINIVRSKP